MLRVTQGPLLHDLSDNVVQPMWGYIAMSTGAQQLSLPLKNLRNKPTRSPLTRRFSGMAARSAMTCSKGSAGTGFVVQASVPRWFRLVQA